MNIIDKILSHSVLVKKPIVIVHIGSEGSNLDYWKKISKNSILISIDGHLNKKKNKNSFIKVIDIKNIISDKNGYSFFYQTKDSHCSSLLMPNDEEVNKWYGGHRFKVVKKEKVKTVTVNDLLKRIGINYIDWLTIDAQGMDLKIFKSINPKIKKEISVIDIEPGFFPFYRNEEKVSEVFRYMDIFFEFSDIKFGENYKVESKQLTSFDKKILFKYDKPTKIYSNITYVNKFSKNLRVILIKIIYLMFNNKLFEIKNMIYKHKKNSFLKVIEKKINYKIFLNKIYYIFALPMTITKKIIKNIIKF